MVEGRSASARRTCASASRAQDERAHYAKACGDIEYHYPWGWDEVEGVANRTDYDLQARTRRAAARAWRTATRSRRSGSSPT